MNSVPLEPTRIQQHGQRWLRFRLKNLLASIAVLALLLAIWASYVESYHAELRRIARIQALDETGRTVQVFTGPRDQYLFRQLFGDKFSQRVVAVHLLNEGVDDVWLRDHLNDLQYVEVLSISSPHVTDRGLSALAELKNLKELILDRTQVTDVGVKELRQNHSGLMRISLQQ